MLYEEQKQFLRAAFTIRLDGTLPYAEVMRGAPKKSGKTTEGAWASRFTAYAR